MFRYTLVTALIFSANGAPNPPSLPRLDGRIVGGLPTTIEEFPYQVSLENYGKHMCGGSIISQDFILTAAHCTFGASYIYLTVRAGSTMVEQGGQVISIAHVYQNPKFDMNTMDYDVSILRLAKPLQLGPGVAPINLITPHAKIDENTKFVVTGWGALEEGGDVSPDLQMVEVPYIENQECQKDYEDMRISERMICAGSKLGGKDACQGDSGGPLVANGVLVGIVSWGYGCARAEYPGVYSRIPELRDYIKNITQL